MATKKTTRPRPAGIPAGQVCKFETPDGVRCKLARVINQPFCREHVGVNMEQMQENNAVGGAAVAAQLRAELDALRAENEVMKAREAAAGERRANLTDTAIASARLDPEIAGAQIVAERTGAPSGQKPTKRRKPANAPDLPREVDGHELVVQRLKQAQELAYEQRAARAKQRKLRGLPADEGRVPIEVHLQRPLDNDWSAVRDDNGNDCREPGFVYRHIRQYDLAPNGAKTPHNRRLHIMKRNYGAEVVQRPVFDAAGKCTGTEDWVTDLGVLVRYPVAEYAQRVIDNAPYGAFDGAMDQELGHLDNIVQQENSRAGVRGGLIDLVVPDGSGSRAVDERLFDQ